MKELFVTTGEIRVPLMGEYFRFPDGKMIHRLGGEIRNEPLPKCEIYRKVEAEVGVDLGVPGSDYTAFVLAVPEKGPLRELIEETSPFPEVEEDPYLAEKNKRVKEEEGD